MLVPYQIAIFREDKNVQLLEGLVGLRGREQNHP
jgi:hypothetical protein